MREGDPSNAKSRTGRIGPLCAIVGIIRVNGGRIAIVRESRDESLQVIPQDVLFAAHNNERQFDAADASPAPSVDCVSVDAKLFGNVTEGHPLSV